MKINKYAQSREMDRIPGLDACKKHGAELETLHQKAISLDPLRSGFHQN
mgnify:CR=1 FL=1